jgi:four helix bundle protein
MIGGAKTRGGRKKQKKPENEETKEGKRNVQHRTFNAQRPRQKRTGIHRRVAPTEGELTMQERESAKYDLQERLLEFTCLIVDTVDSLVRTRTGNHIAGQLIRCGTSPVANHAEAQSAESRRDFVHKLRVALKELRETRVWLTIIERKSLSGRMDVVAQALAECKELVPIFVSSVKTARKNIDTGGAG